jgi:hypothetical protein
VDQVDEAQIQAEMLAQMVLYLRTLACNLDGATLPAVLAVQDKSILNTGYRS